MVFFFFWKNKSVKNLPLAPLVNLYRFFNIASQGGRERPLTDEIDAPIAMVETMKSFS
jgi:hypothetical protein